MQSSLQSLSSEAWASLGSMEGVYESLVDVVPAETKAAPRERHWIGMVAAAAVAAGAYGIHYLPVEPFRVVQDSVVRRPVSAAILAILLGMLVSNLFPIGRAAAAGCKLVVKKGIPVAIVLMGAGLNLAELKSIGLSVLGITLASIGIAISAAVLIGRAMGNRGKLSLLIGAGTGICGNSAIVAVAPLIEAEDEDIVLSIGTVNLLGLVAMLACPLLGGLMHMPSQAFGIWAGTSIHAVPQVVAAGFAYSPDAGTLATLVKLVRVTCMAPMVFVFAMVFARRAASRGGTDRVVFHYARSVPWFVWGFLATSLLATLGLIPSVHFAPAGVLADRVGDVRLSLIDASSSAGHLLLALAMAAIGLEVNIRGLARVSGRAVLTGVLASVVLGLASLGLIQLLL